jgi:hypothetical protein
VSYLARLKAEIAGTRLLDEPTKLTEGPSVGFVGAKDSHFPEIEDHEQRPNADTLPDPAAELRRQRVIAMLVEKPSVRYAVLVEEGVDPDAVILTLAIRGVATCELRIPRQKYDPYLLLQLIEQHGVTMH